MAETDLGSYETNPRFKTLDALLRALRIDQEFFTQTMMYYSKSLNGHSDVHCIFADEAGLQLKPIIEVSSYGPKGSAAIARTITHEKIHVDFTKKNPVLILEKALENYHEIEPWTGQNYEW